MNMNNEIYLKLGQAEVYISQCEEYSIEQLDGSFEIQEGNYVNLDVDYENDKGIYSFPIHDYNLPHFLLAIEKGKEEFIKVCKDLEGIVWSL